ncbi:hypothetical protein KP509_16G010400 [Ceratopteris richardii]|uniref:PROP1-like PPR domain-containing protein n=1 Tax=Ceratopteris richardii TaxID=49495 RepID=A0A8T2SZK9_CERRI|nr:hypothetical protein KP509_16G010400 [Ceratopteris richardii]
MATALLQRLVGRKATGRYSWRTISIADDRSSSHDTWDASWKKQDLSCVVQFSKHVLFKTPLCRRLCSCAYHSCSQLYSHSADRYSREIIKCHTFVRNDHGNRGFSSAVDMQPSSVESVNTNLQKCITITKVCEILETPQWSEEIEKCLCDLNISFTSEMVVSIVRAVSLPTSSLSFFRWLNLNNFKHDISTYGAMLDILGKGGYVDDMKMLVSTMCEGGLMPDSNIYDQVIQWCVHHNDANGASSFLEKLKEDGFTYSASTYRSILALHMKEEKFEDAVSIYLQMFEESVIPSSETLTLLTRSLLEAGKLDYADKERLMSLGKEMRNVYGRPGAVFLIALNSLQKEGKSVEADSFAKVVWPEICVEERNAMVERMDNALKLQSGDEILLQDDSEHLVCVGGNARVALLEIARLLESEGLNVLHQMNLHWTADMVYRTLMLLKNADLAWEFLKWVKSAPEYMNGIKNDVLVLRLLIKNGNFTGMKELLSEMKSRGALTLDTFNSLIKDCAMVKNARAAMWIYNHINESGLIPDEQTFSLLVQAFARGRNPDKASDLCYVMQDVGLKPDVETYTSVVHSLALQGRSDDAWSVYQRMLAVGLKPNVNTYTALLNMMNMTGDTGFGIKLFKEMNDNGVSPTEATLGIMTRIFEAAGNHEESQRLKVQLKFLSSKQSEASLQHIYEILLEGLVEQERSPSLLSF